jgi:hypothetical protein
VRWREGRVARETLMQHIRAPSPFPARLPAL